MTSTTAPVSTRAAAPARGRAPGTGPATGHAGGTAAPVLVGCSHGTDDPLGREAVARILEDVRDRRPGLDVREAFVDVQQPEVADVVREAVAKGAGTAVVVPLLLSAGFHVHVDVAAAVAAEGAAATASGALGPDPRLVDVLVDRLHESGATSTDAVVLAAAGSSDRRSQDAVQEVAAMLRARWSGQVGVGYGSSAAPSVPEAVRIARATGREGRRVVIAAYLLAPGFFHDRLQRAGADVVTAPLAPDPRVADVVLDRYDCAVRAMAGPCLGLCAVQAGCAARG